MQNSTRRQFLLSASAGTALFAQKDRRNPPNILMIMADNLGAWMLGCYGNREIRTPNIDLLARGGLRFTNHYACAPVSSASRATLFTGRTPMQHGVQDFLTARPIDRPPQGQFAPPLAFQKEVMLPDLLADRGYRCGYVGKWHLGADQSPQHKFNYWYTMPDEQAAYENPRMSLNGQAVDEKGYLLDLITNRANLFLDEQKPGSPFLLVTSYAHPHAPYDGFPQKFYDLYAQTTFDSIGWEPAAAHALRDKEYLRQIVPSLRKCAAATTAVDAQIPALIAKLKERGLRDNTLILLVSANGSLLGRHGLWGDGLGSDPINMYEEVARVPMIWNWPGRVPVEAARPELVNTYDLLPTLCDAAAVPVPTTGNRCGHSYLGLALGNPLPSPEPWINLAFGHCRNTEMARDNRFKLVMRDEGKGPGELYDLRNDPRERANLYSNPQFVTARDRLARELERWRKRYSS